MELIVLNPTDDKYAVDIQINDADIKAEVSERLKKYEGLVYSEDQIREAKTDMAGLRKFREVIENKRKEIKKKVLEPYDKFEVKIKEILAIVDKPILMIDGQVKAFEAKTYEEKKKAIEAFYGDHIGAVKNLLPLGRLWSDKWANVTYKMSQIEAEIIARRDQVMKDLEVIETLKSDFELQIKDFYLRTFDLSGALAERARLEDQKKKIEALKAQPSQPVQTEIPMPEQPKQEPEELFTVSFSVTATKRQLDKLKAFFESEKITYGRS